MVGGVAPFSFAATASLHEQWRQLTVVLQAALWLEGDAEVKAATCASRTSSEVWRKARFNEPIEDPDDNGAAGEENESESEEVESSESEISSEALEPSLEVVEGALFEVTDLIVID